MGKIIKIVLVLVGLALIVLSINQYSMSKENNGIANLNSDKMVALLQGRSETAISPDEKAKLDDYSEYATEARGKSIDQKNMGHMMIGAGVLLALVGVVSLFKKKKV